MDEFVFNSVVIISMPLTGFAAGLAAFDFRDTRALFVGVAVMLALSTIGSMIRGATNYLATAP